jgi:signal transduction histidine kinase
MSNNQYADRIPKELRDSRILLAALIDNQGRILYCNEVLCNIFHLQGSANHHYTELIHTDDLANFRDGLSVALSGKMVSNIIARIPDHCEDARSILWEIAPTEDPLRKEEFVLALGTQLQKATLHRVIGSADSEMVNNLLRRNRDLEQFANIVSHNIRAPLANIMGLNKLLNLKLSDTDKETALKGIRVSAEKLEGVIKDLNDVLAVRRTDLSNEVNVNLLKLVDDIRLSLGDTLNLSQATIICDFEEVPEVRAVKSYLQSIFYNMITNAIKYARPGVPPVVRIHSFKKDSRISISFSDNGTGIDLTRHGANLFGLYKRFNDRVEGKGLGLYMVKTQVEAMQGTIEAESIPGEGTTFTVTLPA